MTTKRCDIHILTYMSGDHLLCPSIFTDIQSSVVLTHNLTWCNVADTGGNGATGPLAFCVSRLHKCVETVWQLRAALRPTAVAASAVRG